MDDYSIPLGLVHKQLSSTVPSERMPGLEGLWQVFGSLYVAKAIVSVLPTYLVKWHKCIGPNVIQTLINVTIESAKRKEYLTEKHIEREGNWLKRRYAIEPIIGHTKSDHLLDHSHMKDKNGDKTSAILAGCGLKLRKLPRAVLFVNFQRAVQRKPYWLAHPHRESQSAL